MYKNRLCIAQKIVDEVSGPNKMMKYRYNVLMNAQTEGKKDRQEVWNSY